MINPTVLVDESDKQVAIFAKREDAVFFLKCQANAEEINRLFPDPPDDSPND